jgi:DNA mismatch repair protein MutL
MGIRVLSTHLVNKIAAGEVIERPASIVKELVENALDAGASRIDVVIEDGGRRLISVADDGKGMDADDLALAFTPHATSKLAEEDDLFRIATMGFRGEALASIASVSHAQIRTRRRGDDGGHEISAGGEEIGEVRPCSASPGTTVTVRDLFFNTPARRKFLRTSNTEAGHVSEQIARLSLPHPDVAFSLTHGKRTKLTLPSTESTRQRIGDLFTPDLAESLLPLIARPGPAGVSGLLAPPSAARGSGKWQYFFLNGRYIRDRLLAHALREAYRGLMEPTRYPVAFLFLQVDPSEVDVNVHPTKIEVRFRNSQMVHGELMSALKDTLNRASLTPDVSLPSPVDGPPDGATESDGADAQQRQNLREALADFFRATPPSQPRFSFPEESSSGRHPSEHGRSHGLRAAGAPAPFPPHGNPAAASVTDESSPERSDPPPPATETPVASRTDTDTTPAPASRAREVMQVHNSYIVAPVEDGVLIVDQHALHERLIYNDLRGRLAEGSLPGQRMLIPETLSVTEGEADLLDRQADLLKRLGIEVEPFGPRTIAIQQFPALLTGRGVSAGVFLRELLDHMTEDETVDSERLLGEVLNMMACKAAVKAGDPLTPGEIEALLARRETAEKASSCPHGRPTTIKLTLRDLEKQFKRT